MNRGSQVDGEIDHKFMKQEVIEDFLTVPGIAGVALADGIALPYFYGFDAILAAAEQETIARNIHQVLETTPEEFNSFEFQFDFYRVYLHKLKQGFTLIVLAKKQLPRFIYTQAVRRLLVELQLGPDLSIAEFRVLADRFLMPPAVEPDSAPTPAASPLSSETTAANQVVPPQVPVSTVHLSDTHLSDVTLKDVLAAINALSRFATQYLGTLVVANYWKVTRPAVDWLNRFQIERSGQMTFAVESPSERLPDLQQEQYQCLKNWVAAFIQRCSKVIRDFARLAQQALDPSQQVLLFDPST